MSTPYAVMRNPGRATANAHDSWWVIERHQGGPHEGAYWRWVATTSAARRAHNIADALRVSDEVSP